MASAARRDGRHLLVLRAALDVLPPDVEQFLPSQLPDRHAVHAAGPRALLTRLLVLALCEAGWPLDGCSSGAGAPPRHRVRWQTQRTLAVRWLLGELDDQVAVPVRLDCDVLGIDGDARGGVAAHPGRGRRSGQHDDDAMNAHERRDAVGARTSFSQKASNWSRRRGAPEDPFICSTAPRGVSEAVPIAVDGHGRRCDSRHALATSGHTTGGE
jgi:hypothetical protein